VDEVSEFNDRQKRETPGEGFPLALRAIHPSCAKWRKGMFRSLRRATKGAAFGNRHPLKRVDRNFIIWCKILSASKTNNTVGQVRLSVPLLPTFRARYIKNTIFIEKIQFCYVQNALFMLEYKRVCLSLCRFFGKRPSCADFPRVFFFDGAPIHPRKETKNVHKKQTRFQEKQ